MTGATGSRLAALACQPAGPNRPEYHFGRLEQANQQQPKRQLSCDEAAGSPLAGARRHSSADCELERGQLEQLATATTTTASQMKQQQQQQPEKHGNVLGIFFKVWSLVKVSNKSRRQPANSVDANTNFRYIPAASKQQAARLGLLGVSAAAASSTTSVDLNHQLAGTNSSGSTSSGVSSGAGGLPTGGGGYGSSPSRQTVGAGSAANRLASLASSQADGDGRPMFRYDMRRSTADVAAKLAQADCCASAELGAGRHFSFNLAQSQTKIRRSATSIIPTASRAFARRQLPAAAAAGVASVAGQHGHSSRSSLVADDRCSSLATSSQLDVYSTPHNSIQSMPISRQQADLFGSQVGALTKSTSFGGQQQLLAAAAAGHCCNQQHQQHQQQCSTISEEPQPGAARSRALVAGSRFFISSSSSDDSSAQAAHLAPPPSSSKPTDLSRAAKLECQRQLVAVQQGVHLHPGRSHSGGYQRSPSLFEMSTARCPGRPGEQPVSRRQLAAFERQLRDSKRQLVHSVSLYDYKKLDALGRRASVRLVDADSDGLINSSSSSGSSGGSISDDDGTQTDDGELGSSPSVCPTKKQHQQVNKHSAEYRLAEMLLQFGPNVDARDAHGCTSLMRAVESENVPAIRCLIEHGADLNATNAAGQGLLELISRRRATPARLRLFKLLIDSKTDVDADRCTGPRLLERLIRAHRAQPGRRDKLAYIECLLQSGAKLGSATWLAASQAAKRDVQVSLLKKLCQDGYYLYKQGCIEAAVFRFEYLLRWLSELERQLVASRLAPGVELKPSQRPPPKQSLVQQQHELQLIKSVAEQIKYQTYLGLSRCERKRKFYKRALEFAHMAILVDSGSYEAFYSKAHILKDLGDTHEALLTVGQADGLAQKAADSARHQLEQLLDQREDQLMLMDPLGGALGSPSYRLRWLRYNASQSAVAEFRDNFEYFEASRKYIAKLKHDILADKLNDDATTSTAAAAN